MGSGAVSPRAAANKSEAGGARIPGPLNILQGSLDGLLRSLTALTGILKSPPAPSAITDQASEMTKKASKPTKKASWLKGIVDGGMGSGAVSPRAAANKSEGGGARIPGPLNILRGSPDGLLRSLTTLPGILNPCRPF